MNSRLFSTLAGLGLLLATSPSQAENEIGFIERFALAADREKVLGELVPGTEDYYFYHALHYQNTRNKAKLAELLTQWQKRLPDDTSRRGIIENRESLLTYDADPQATLEHLKRMMGVEFNHEQVVRDKKPDLPTALDAKRIDRSVFLADSLRNNERLEGLTIEALEALVRDRSNLSVQQRRAVLSKLQRPDVPGLVELIITELRNQEAHSFGEFAIHRALLPEQLDQLLQAVPELVNSEAYVYTRVRKLAPGAEVNLEYDTAEREAWLTRVWAYAKSLPAAFNSLKAQVLYLRLDHDRRAGVYDSGVFLEYLRLPRSFGYVNERLLEQAARAQAPISDLNADLSHALLSYRPIGEDEALVRDYFLHLFASGEANVATAIKPYTTLVRDSWLKPVFAEAMITSGQGDPERWASLLSPSDFQRLKDRVDIEFPPTNAPFFASSEEAQFDVIVKNTPKLLVKIYELNTLNFFLTQKRQLNTDLNLDGLVANSEQTRTFETGPFKRERFTFKLADFKFAEPASKRGAWVVEFIGGGRSSRALVRAGQWQVLQQTGPAGDLLLVVDEKGDPVKDSVAWLDGRKYTLDEKLGRIVVPYTNQPGMKALVLADAAGTFATLTQFDHHGEDYRLDTQFHIEREQLLARRQATLAVRTALMLGETHLAPELLSEPKLTITSTTHDGISTTREVKDLKLSAGSVLTHSLVVPERLATLTVVLTAKVEVLSGGGEKRDLSAAHTWQLNGIDKTDAVHDGHLSLFDGQRVYELLGKNGEPVPDQQVIFTFKHRDFNRTQTVALRTDDKGRVGLGTLAGIASLTARAPNGRQGSWSLEDSLITHASVVHVQEGEALRVPVSVAQVNVTNASLLELHAGTFTADHSAQLVLRDGFLMADALKAGDYSLRLPMENREVAVKVTAGKRVGGWYLGKHRNLEAKGDRTLQIINLDTSDKDKVSVKLANATAFTRVHIAASRFEAGRGLFGGLGQFARFGAASGNPAKLPVLYSAGREIGDEYRYILERRYAKPYPGNMLTRPGLLLNPWEVRSTDLEELRQSAGEGAGATQGGSAAAMSRAKAEIPASAPPSSGAAGANLDFLADSAPVIFNLIPDKDGVVWFERKALGDRQHLQVYAEDLDNAVWKVLSFPEANTKLADQRLARNLDPVKPFTQKKEITVLAAGKTLTLAEILTSEMESYDTLGGIYSLFTTLTNDATLAKFDWLLKWPLLKEDEKRAKYSEFACHELNLFVARKDKAFFDAVVKPYLANKKDKTFMDHYLLATDLTRYLEPWAYGRLNAVERCLLAQRIEGEAPNAARHLRELWELEPPDPEADDRRFETALRGRAMELADESSLSRAKKDYDDRTTGNTAIPEMAPAPVMAPAAAGGPAPVDFLSGSGVSSLGMSLKRSMTADEGESLVRLESEAKQNMPALKPQEMALQEVANGRVMVLSGGALALGDNAVGDRLGYFGSVVTKSGRATVRAYFRQLGPTKEWAENNYYQHRITEQNEKLVPVNAFWRDYAAWIAEGAKSPFVSANVAEATHNHTEMLLALAVLDLPFEAPKHITKAEGGRFDFTAAGPVIVYHKEIKTATAADAKLAQLLVSQSFFRHTDRFEERGNEKFEKYVTEEFLTGEVYGANIVVTNPSSSPAKAEVLLQIPQGALPVLNSKATDSRQVRLEPYTTQTFEYRFYFPAVSAKVGVKFPHFPVNVAIAGTNAGSAKPFEFNVVARFTQVDKASWEYVSQDGTEAEVLAYLGSNNVERVDLSKVAWRCRRSVDFYRKLTTVLRSRHVWDDTIASYALLHNDTGTVGEWLKHHGEFTTLCGPYLASQLITLDPVERHDFEHLEYSPLINQRAHRVGNEWRIANPALLEQYSALAGTLAFKPRLDDADNMSVVYYLFLQDRVEEALARFASINPNALPTKIQYDYIRCYAAFYEGNLAEARSIATARANEPVVRWKSLFADVLSQLDEIDGKPAKSEKGDKPDREKETADLAATEPALDLKVENRTITLTWKNVGDVTLNYYLMDPEFSFSSSPFVSQDASRFSIIRPNKTAVQSLPAGKDSIEVPLPAEFAKANVLVEAVSAGLRKTQAYHANTLKLTVTENYGRLEARDSVGGKPVGKAYVKVYARLKNGTLRFFKDGYTDLRGRFDYASLNGPEGHVQPPPTPYEPAPANGLDYQMLKPVELNSIDKLAVLVLSDTNGTMVKEVNPPQQ